jgi:hypothetical protein
MRTLRPIGLAGAILSAARSGPHPPPFKPVADTTLLMQSVVECMDATSTPTNEGL